MQPEIARQVIPVRVPKVTGSLVRMVLRVAGVVSGLFAECPHRNTHFPGWHTQRCWGCGRVRSVGTHVEPGPWRWEVR